jgi:hypothetical protein
LHRIFGVYLLIELHIANQSTIFAKIETTMRKLALFLFMFGIVASFSAQTMQDNRQDRRLERRATRGMREGKIDPQEAGEIREDRRRVRRAERRSMRDGVVTPHEERKINRRQRQERREIRRATENPS